MAQIETPRFGTLTYNEEDLLFFPRGIPGFYTLLYWMVAGDEENPVKWLQSVDDPLVALPITAPDLILPEYNAKVSSEELEELDSPAQEELIILVVLTIPQDQPWNMTANLKAPIIINTTNRKGKQILLDQEEYPVRFYCFSEEKRMFFAQKAEQDAASSGESPRGEGDNISVSPESSHAEGNDA